MDLLQTGFEEHPEEGAPIPIPASTPNPEIEAIRAQQAAYVTASDALIEVYRTLDRTKRVDVKRGLRELYKKMVDLAVTLGISRFACDHVWAG